MKHIALSAILVSMALAPAPALARWKIVEGDVAAEVAKGTMKATPDEDWNRWTRRPIKKSEVWTLDGANLNEVYFVGGLLPSQTLYRDVKKKQRPLPKFRTWLDLTDIPDFVESSMRVALDTSVYKVTGVEPAEFAGRPGIRFTFDYAVGNSPLERKGLVVGTLVDDSLYLVTFSAPAIYFYDRDLQKVEAIIESVTF